MGFVYIMRSGAANVVKIGRARNVELRRGQFMTGNPEALTVIDSIETDQAGPCETFLHRMFQSKRVRGEFFALTPAEAQEAGRKAREYLADYVPAERDARRLAQADCDGPARRPEAREQELHHDLLEAREAKYRAEIDCARLENELKLAIGTSEGLEGLVSWRTHTLTRVDETAFKREHPGLHSAFTHTVRHRTFRVLWS